MISSVFQCNHSGRAPVAKCERVQAVAMHTSSSPVVAKQPQRVAPARQSTRVGTRWPNLPILCDDPSALVARDPRTRACLRASCMSSIQLELHLLLPYLHVPPSSRSNNHSNFPSHQASRLYSILQNHHVVIRERSQARCWWRVGSRSASGRRTHHCSPWHP